MPSPWPANLWRLETTNDDVALTPRLVERQDNPPSESPGDEADPSDGAGPEADPDQDPEPEPEPEPSDPPDDPPPPPEPSGGSDEEPPDNDDDPADDGEEGGPDDPPDNDNGSGGEDGETDDPPDDDNEQDGEDGEAGEQPDNGDDTDNEDGESDTPPPPPPTTSSSTSTDSSSTTGVESGSSVESEDTDSSSSGGEPLPTSGGSNVIIDITTVTSDGVVYTSTRTSTMFLPDETGGVLPANDQDTATVSTGAIAGGVVGGVGAMVIVTVLALIACKRRRRRHLEKTFDGNFDPASVSRGSTSVSRLEAGVGQEQNEKQTSWKKRMSLRPSIRREPTQEPPNAPRLEDATLPQIDLADQPLDPTDPFMTERDDALTAASVRPHHTGSSHTSSLPPRHLNQSPTHYSPTTANSSTHFGASGSPMGMAGPTAPSRPVSLHQAGVMRSLSPRPLSVVSAASVPLGDPRRSTSPPFPSAR